MSKRLVLMVVEKLAVDQLLDLVKLLLQEF